MVAAGVVEAAARQAAPVVGDDGVVSGEVADQVGGAVRVALPALRDEERGPGAVHLVVDGGAVRAEHAVHGVVLSDRVIRTIIHQI
ncbi:hypothetical protein GCM10027161_60820 [Microbispora hainanensis]